MGGGENPFYQLCLGVNGFISCTWESSGCWRSFPFVYAGWMWLLLIF